MNSVKERTDSMCTSTTRVCLEKLLGVETRYHNSEVSKRLLKYAGLMQYKPVIDEIVKEKGYKYVDQHSVSKLPNEEIEDAVDLYIEYMDADEMELARCFAWALCVPSVLAVYFQVFHTYVDNCRIYKDLRRLEDTFINIAYEEFCDVLSKHILHYKNGDFNGGKGALRSVLRKRLYGNATEEFIKEEFGPAFGYLNQTDREHERSKEDFYWAHGYEPSLSELAEFLGISLRAIIDREECVKRKRSPVFLDQNISADFNIHEKCWFDGKCQASLVHREIIADDDLYMLMIKLLPEDKLNIVKDRYGFNETQRGLTI